MKRETIYALMAGCAFFFVVFYAAFRYFTPPERPVDSSATAGSVPGKTADAIPVVAKELAPVPDDADKSSSPVGSPSVAPATPAPTPTAYGVAVQAGHSRASSPSQVTRPSGQDDEETPRNLQAGRYRGRSAQTAAQRKAKRLEKAQKMREE